MWSTSLRATLLDGYDKISPPISTRLVDYSEAGTDVTLNIRFFKIEGVDQSGGTMSIKVWWRMRWDDERLAWDPSAYGGITKLSFAAADSTDLENTEIWAPDVQPYNAKSGLMNTLEPARATVTHTGHVYWARPGSLTVLCRFSGLVAFPFDKLIRTYEFDDINKNVCFPSKACFSDHPSSDSILTLNNFHHLALGQKQLSVHLEVFADGVLIFGTRAHNHALGLFLKRFRLCFKGRWKSLTTLHHYIQEGVSSWAAARLALPLAILLLFLLL